MREPTLEPKLWGTVKDSSDVAVSRIARVIFQENTDCYPRCADGVVAPSNGSSVGSGDIG